MEIAKNFVKFYAKFYAKIWRKTCASLAFEISRLKSHSLNFMQKSRERFKSSCSRALS